MVFAEREPSRCCPPLSGANTLQAGGMEGGADAAEELTEEEGREILEMKNSSDIYTDMTNSIAPTVFGHSEVRAFAVRATGDPALFGEFTAPPKGQGASDAIRR